MRMRPPMVELLELVWVVTLVRFHSSCGPFGSLVPLLLRSVPPVMAMPPGMFQTWMVPADVSVPLLSVTELIWSPQPRPVPSPVVSTVAPLSTVSAPRMLPVPPKLARTSLPSLTLVPLV